MAFSKSELAKIAIMATKIDDLFGVSERKNEPENQPLFQAFHLCVNNVVNIMKNTDAHTIKGITANFNELIGLSMKIHELTKSEPAVANAPIYQKFGKTLNMWHYNENGVLIR